MFKIIGAREKEDESSPSGWGTTLFTISPDGGDYKELANLAFEGGKSLRGGAIAVDRGIVLTVWDWDENRSSLMFSDKTTGEQSIIDLGLSDYEELGPISPESDKYRYMGDEYISFFAKDLKNGGGRLIDLNTNTLQSSSQDFPFASFGSISRNLVVTPKGIYSRSDYSVPYASNSYYWYSNRIYEPDIPDGSYKHLHFNNTEDSSGSGFYVSEYGLHGGVLHRPLIPFYPDNYSVLSDFSRVFNFHSGGTTAWHYFVSDGQLLGEVGIPTTAFVRPLASTQVQNDFFFSEDGRYAVVLHGNTGFVYSALDNGAYYDLSGTLSSIDRDSSWVLLGSTNDSGGEEKRPVFWTELKNTIEVY